MRIITKDDYLIVTKVRYGNFIGSPKEIIQMNSNAVLFTPIELLENSRKEFMLSLKMPPPSKEEKND